MNPSSSKSFNSHISDCGQVKDRCEPSFKLKSSRKVTDFSRNFEVDSRAQNAIERTGLDQPFILKQYPFEMKHFAMCSQPATNEVFASRHYLSNINELTSYMTSLEIKSSGSSTDIIAFNDQNFSYRSNIQQSSPLLFSPVSMGTCNSPNTPLLGSFSPMELNFQNQDPVEDEIFNEFIDESVWLHISNDAPNKTFTNELTVTIDTPDTRSTTHTIEPKVLSILECSVPVTTPKPKLAATINKTPSKLKGTKRGKSKTTPKLGRPIGCGCVACDCGGTHKTPLDRSPRKFMCSICHKCFKRKPDLRRHEKCNNKIIPCLFPGCTRMFARVDNMRQHCTLCHNMWD
ncbi:hypothetical protein HK096_007218 [Nowakowskiella sp. JEL0078]|nr:hypothetical protein HK096_007218 [Nowakowskiella sp. JEL0078]